MVRIKIRPGLRLGLELHYMVKILICTSNKTAPSAMKSQSITSTMLSYNHKFGKYFVAVIIFESSDRHHQTRG